jgi:predicted GNAT family acetyltransferase
MEFINEGNRIYMNDESGKMLAEVTFPAIADNVVNINHTYVDDSLRGQGIADKLLTAVVVLVQKENKKVYPTCSYAVKWFERHTEYADLLTDEH